MLKSTTNSLSGNRKGMHYAERKNLRTPYALPPATTPWTIRKRKPVITGWSGKSLKNMKGAVAKPSVL